MDEVEIQRMHDKLDRHDELHKDLESNVLRLRKELNSFKNKLFGLLGTALIAFLILLFEMTAGL